MSSFIEFQAMVLNKLCAIEERISNIEAVLGIPEPVIAEETEEAVTLQEKNSLKNEICDFQKQLDDFKSLFSASDN